MTKIVLNSNYRYKKSVQGKEVNKIPVTMSSGGQTILNIYYTGQFTVTGMTHYNVTIRTGITYVITKANFHKYFRKVRQTPAPIGTAIVTIQPVNPILIMKPQVKAEFIDANTMTPIESKIKTRLELLDE